MPIERLDHVNLRTTRLAEMIQWYEEILGLSAGARPAFSMDGAWLYAGEVAAVHLVAVEDDGAAGSETALKLEHFAFRASGNPEEFRDKLQQRGVAYRRSGIEDMNLSAFNVWDPDGNHIHVDFVEG
ncbi:diguanylate cyclase [Tateyamaria omphalii]|uniref:VOC family protein n=1 Tax=Tateyamaria omphalii TaxID=299262 RepID=UPI001675683A|nr:VOC family protein [Tateyamaria omphalii]GGX63579.1 diguanylate cyclase [Tateyamaria omphalii]